VIRLHDYWRSAACYRVRIALNFKGIGYQSVPHDLRLGQQRASDYLVTNPQGLVPTLEAEGQTITQSVAVIEWLEERYPLPRLLPEAMADRAVVRSMAALICADVHPLNNLRVLTELRSKLSSSKTQIQDWLTTWMHAGFSAMEQLIARHGKGIRLWR
jgi:maleylpyruvate isomerase